MLPEEILNREFNKTFKGYDVSQVEGYIDTLLGLYEQLENENKELAGRCEQANAALEECRGKVAEAEKIISLKGEITESAKAEAQSIISDAKSRSAAAIQSAENAARKLLTEVKLKADEMSADADRSKAEADAEAQRTVEQATEEARSLIKATKQSCAVRLEQCERMIAQAKAEYAAVTKEAADFRRGLFELYSANILSIENMLIPEVDFDAEVEAAAQRAHDDDDDGSDDTLAPQQIPSSEQDEAADAEQSDMPRTNDVADEQTENVPPAQESDDSAAAQPESPAEQDSIEHTAAPSQQSPARFAGFDVETEHSGQVHYDSTDIGSVNGRLDDIMSRKGKQDGTKNLSGKLGFLK